MGQIVPVFLFVWVFFTIWGKTNPFILKLLFIYFLEKKISIRLVQRLVGLLSEDQSQSTGPAIQEPSLTQQLKIGCNFLLVTLTQGESLCLMSSHNNNDKVKCKVCYLFLCFIRSIYGFSACLHTVGNLSFSWESCLWKKLKMSWYLCCTGTKRWVWVNVAVYPAVTASH